MKDDLKELLETYPLYKKATKFLKGKKKLVITVSGVLSSSFLLMIIVGINDNSKEKEVSNKVPSLNEYQQKENADINATDFSTLYEGMNVEDINFLQK